MLESGVVPALLHVLQTADFDTKKEAAWAVSNAVSGGSDAQVIHDTTRTFLARLSVAPSLS